MLGIWTVHIIECHNYRYFIHPLVKVLKICVSLYVIHCVH
jgi:hypothetical protein